MILAIILSVTLLLLISFCVTSRRIHLFEIFFLWLIITLLIQSLSWIILVNLEWITVSTKLGKYWSHFSNRLILCPLIIIYFFDFSVAIQKNVPRYSFLFLAVLILTLVDYGLMFLGILHNHDWKVGYSVVEWIFTIAISYFFWQWYRRKFFIKEPT